MQERLGCLKIAFRKYGDAVVDSCSGWSHDVLGRLEFLWHGALAMGQWLPYPLHWENNHRATVYGQRGHGAIVITLIVMRHWSYGNRH